MSTIDTQNEQRGSLSLSSTGVDKVEVLFRPSDATYRFATGKSAAAPAVKIALFDAAANSVSVFPRVTSPSSRILEPKYQIEEIVFDDLNLELPVIEEDVAELANQFPEGFIRDPYWGFGIQKNYLPIIGAISKIDNITKLVLTKEGPTGLDKDGLDDTVFYLTYRDYETLRRAMNRIQTHFQKESLTDREIFSHNTILTRLDTNRFPPKSRPYKPDTIYKFLGGMNSQQYSTSDQNAILQAVTQHATEIATKEPEKLLKLHQKIELVTLDRLLIRFDELLAGKTTEAVWQKLFQHNPFILTMAFGYSIVVVSEQAHVGGVALSGVGGKIADYLVKNDLTNNAAIIEIKKPGTELVLDRIYRKGVHSIAPELTDTILQVLDQRHHFVSAIAMHKMQSSVEIESYSVPCVIIAGRTPTDRLKAKAFELYRNSQKDVYILTFDELRNRLFKLREFLSSPTELEKMEEAEPDRV